MDAHIFCDVIVVHLFKCIFNLGPRAVFMLQVPPRLNPALFGSQQSFVTFPN